MWLKPELVVTIEYAEWTPADHVRHSRFVVLRDDKDARKGNAGAIRVKEPPGSFLDATFEIHAIPESSLPARSRFGVAVAKDVDGVQRFVT